MLDKIRSILIDQLGLRSTEPNEIPIDSHLVDDLGADSLDSVTLLMRLEEEFDCEIDDDIAENWQTVGDIINYFENT